MPDRVVSEARENKVNRCERMRFARDICLPFWKDRRSLAWRKFGDSDNSDQFIINIKI